MRGTIDKGRILELYLGAKSTQEIADELGVTRPNIEYHLANIVSDHNFHLAELSEKLALVVIGRLEKALSAIWPEVLKGDYRAIKALIDISKVEMEWKREILPPSNESEETAIVVERFEQTITSNTGLYDIALSNMQDEWMNGEMNLDDIYAAAPASLDDVPGLTDRISKVEKIVDKVIGDDDGESD